MLGDQTTDRGVGAVGLVIVLVLHAAILWVLWQHRLIPTPQNAMTLFVNLIAPADPQMDEPPKPSPPKPRPVEKPQPRQLAAETPTIAPADYVALPQPQPAPVIEAPLIAAPRQVGPVTLGAELSVSCPDRTPPDYPSISRRLGEEGTVILRVELDEQGRVGAAHIVSSSGHPRLDDAGMAAVRTWRCTPASRNGQPVRAVALQPFKFILQGN